MPTELTFADYIGIQNAFSAYSRAIDDRDWGSLGKAFAPDAVWTLTTGFAMNGVAEMQEMMSQAPMPYRYLHMVSNQQFTVDGDAVNSTSNWTYLIRKEPEGGKPTENMETWDAWGVGSVGTYEDRLEKFDGTWLFSSRRIYNWEFAPPAGL